MHNWSGNTIFLSEAIGNRMVKLTVFFFLFVRLSYGIEYSLRIKALGTDFAYLVPDYETDLYQNPQLLGEKLTGVCFEPDLNEPLTLRVYANGVKS